MRPPIVDTIALNSYRQSVHEIASISSEFCEDMKGIHPDCFDDIYYAVCSLPYVEDDYGDEVGELLSRPCYILDMVGADCKKKSILIASWCNLHGVPVRFVVMSNRPDGMPHHIYTEVLHHGKWRAADATYPDNKLGSYEPETFREVFEYET